MGIGADVGRLVHLKPHEVAVGLGSAQCETHNHVHQAHKEHHERNLIDAMHHAQVYVLFFLLSEQVQRVDVVR